MTMNLTITEEITSHTLMNMNMFTCIVTVQRLHSFLWIIVEKEMMDNAGKKRKGGAWDEIQSTVPAQKKGASHWFCYRRGRHQHRNTRRRAGKRLSDEPTTKPERRETEDKAEEECLAATVGHISGSKPLVLLQVNCRSICNEVL